MAALFLLFGCRLVKSGMPGRTHGIRRMDSYWANRWLACRSGHEGRWLWHSLDIILGLLGGILGGWIFGMLGIWQGGGMIGSIIVAFVGAVILVWITRLLKKA